MSADDVSAARFSWLWLYLDIIKSPTGEQYDECMADFEKHIVPFPEKVMFLAQLQDKR